MISAGSLAYSLSNELTSRRPLDALAAPHEIK
jgi:hypothetical protein